MTTTIPLSVYLGQRGAGGVPDLTRADNLKGTIETYDHTICDRFGFESMRVNWHDSVPSALAWGREDHLGRPAVSYGPYGDLAWEGVLYEITVTIGRVKLVLSLKDMANRLIVAYRDPNGGQDATSTYSNAQSIATWGTKDRLLKLSTTLSAAAGNRAQTALSGIAFPGNKQPDELGTGDDDDVSVELRFVGWYALLDWLLTSSTSNTSTSISTQAISLLTTYNATNNIFSTVSYNVQSSLPSDTEYIEPQTTIRDKLETLLAQGDSSHNRLFWGIFEDRELHVRTWAGATPDTITYYENASTGIVRDAYRNVVEPWLVRPDAMALVEDIHDLEPPDGAVAGFTRKYVARVACRVDRNSAKVSLEPDNVDNLETLLSSPTGAGPAGTSERQAAVERKLTAAGRPHFSGTNGIVDLGGTGRISTAGGSIATGGGSIATGGGSIDTNGGSISNSTPGNSVDLSTGSGIGGTGSSGVTTTGGTVGGIPKWTASGQLGTAVANTDYAAASHASRHGSAGADPVALAASQITTGTIATARLGSGSASSSTFLRGDQTWATLSASNIPAHASTHENGGSDELALDASQITTGTMATARLGSGSASSSTFLRGDQTWAAITPATIGAIDGSGTASRLAQWSDSDTLAASTLIKSGAGVLTISAPSTASLAVNSTSSLDLSGGLITMDSAHTLTVTGDASLSGTPAPNDAKYIVQQASSGLGAEQALSSLATGLLKNTTTTGVLSIAVAGTDYASASHTHAAGDITSGTIATARLGSGTASSTKFLRGDSTWTTAPSGSATSGQVAFWDSANSVAGDPGLGYDAATNDLAVQGNVSCSSLNASARIQTGSGIPWDLGNFTSGALAATGYVTVQVDGITRRLLVG